MFRRWCSYKVNPRLKLTNEDIKKYYMLIKQSEYELEENKQKYRNGFDSVYAKKSNKFKLELRRNLINIINEIVSVKLELPTPEVEFDNELKSELISDNASRVQYCRSIIQNVYFNKCSPTQTNLLNYFKYKYNGSNKQFHNSLTLEERERLKFELIDHVSKGEDIIGNKFAKFKYNNVIGLNLPPNQYKVERKIPNLDLKININTGKCEVRDIDEYYIWNYYLAKRLNDMSYDESLFSEKMKIIEKEYIDLDKAQLSNEVSNVIESGHYYLQGKLESFKIINKTIRSLIYRHPIKFEFNRDRYSTPKYIINSTSGYILPIIQNIDEQDALDYYIAKYKSNLLNWNKLKKKDKQALLQEYIDLLKSGNDIYLGELVSIQDKIHNIISNKHFKLSNSIRKKYIVEIFGQVYITELSTSAIPEVLPIPYIVDSETDKIEILKPLNEWYYYNYYMGKQLPYKTIVEIENEWEMMNKEDRKKIGDEYLALLKSGKDLLYGKEVSISEKIKNNEKVQKLLKLRIVNKKSLFLKRNNEYRKIAKDGIVKVLGHLSEDDVYKYFKHVKLNEEGLRLDEINKQWQKINNNEKKEYRQAYEFLLSTNNDVS
ncbi:unnamed protein product [Candida verbasci]|uniref:Uncharacterized protein n=1 Tax=Candida verbasci TaxID=1227364 RepID=A0A9W4TY62_9ASCO|nr:unnamed protein product [Candida verbasci]